MIAEFWQIVESELASSPEFISVKNGRVVFRVRKSLSDGDGFLFRSGFTKNLPKKKNRNLRSSRRRPTLAIVKRFVDNLVGAVSSRITLEESPSGHFLVNE